MQKMGKILKNFQSNLWFLLSFMGILALAFESERGLFKIVLLLFGVCFFGCFFFCCSSPLTKDAFKNKNAVLLAMAVEFTFLLNFTKNFTPGILKQAAQVMHIPPQWLFMASGVVLCVVGFYAAYVLSDGCLCALHPFKVIICQSWKQILILSAVFCVSTFAIIRANYNYIDDLGRAHTGYQMTGDYSRYIASFMSVFVHSNAYLADISPIPQLLAACILAFTAVVLYALLTDNRKITFWNFIALVPLGTFPLFLQCYSYKYDAPYMAFGVLAAIAPLVYHKRSNIKILLAVSVGTILVCTTYQTASGIFPLVTVAVGFGMWKRNTPVQKILQFLAATVLGYLAGMLIFRFIIMGSVNPTYVNTSISLSAVISNLNHYCLLLSKWFSPVWLLLLTIIAFSFVCYAISTTARNKVATLIVSLCVLLLIYVLSFGVYLFFETPLFTPRGMFGVGVAIVVCCIPVSVSKKQHIGRAAIALLCCCFFIFSFTYGNALNVQNQYTHLRLDQVISDIKNLEITNSGKEVYVQVTGSIGHPKHMEGTYEEWPLLDDMVSIQLRDSIHYWGDYELLHYTGMNGILVSNDECDLTQYDLPVLVDNLYHTIRGNEGYLLIELK